MEAARVVDRRMGGRVGTATGIMTVSSVSAPEIQRSEVEPVARVLEGMPVAWTFKRGEKAGDKERAKPLPEELGARAGFLAEKLRGANMILPARANGLFLVDGDTRELVSACLEIGGPTLTIQ